MKNSSSTSLALILLAACTLSASACGDQDHPDSGPQGSVSLRVTVGSHAVDVLDYVIERPGDSAIEGALDVSGPETTVDRHIGSLPVGDNYVITLSATTVDELQTCFGSSAPFEIVADGTTSLVVTVSCRDVEDETTTSTSTDTSSTGTSTTSTDTSSTDTSSTDTASEVGDLSIEVPFNSCPKIGSTSAVPGSTPVGTAVELVVSVSDENGDALTVSWSEDGITFADGSVVAYACTEVKVHELQVSTNDGHCTATATVSVDCTI